MHLACLALILSSGSAPQELWTSCEEVYSLEKHDGHLYAGTSGGVLVYTAEKGWGFTSPVLVSPAYKLQSSSYGLNALGPFGDFQWTGSEWIGLVVNGFPAASTVLPTFVSATPKAHVDDSSGNVIESRTGESLGRPGKGRVYALFDAQRGTVAGTSDGMWAYREGKWIRETLPSTSPMPRLHGLASAGRRGWIAGGLGGLAIGRPGAWEMLNRRPVRRIVPRKKEVWVVYGDGTVDKFEPEENRWQHDVFYGSVKRPWASMIAVAGDDLLVGGQSGWLEKSPRSQTEVRPDWFAGDVVTAMTMWKGKLVVAGQKTGLHIRDGKDWRHFNAAHGLNDLWVVAVAEFEGRLWIATATEGLFSTDGRSIRSETFPIKKMTSLQVANGRLAAGTMSGAFRRTKKTWTPIGATLVETTAISFTDDALWVMTPFSAGLYRDSGMPK